MQKMWQEPQGSAPDFLEPDLTQIAGLLCLEGVPDLHGAPQDEAGLTRKFETSHVGVATREESRVLCFPSIRGLTPRVSL